MFELFLGRYLVKPLFSILLGLGATVGVASFLIVLSLFQNYELSMERVFMGIHPHVTLTHPGMSMAEAQDWARRLRGESESILQVAPALYLRTAVEVARVNTRKALCRPRGETAVCAAADPDGEGLVEPRYGFDILEAELQELLIKGVTIQEGRTLTRIAPLIQGYTDLERLNLTHNEHGVPIPLGFYMEGLGPDAVLDDYLLRRPGNSWQHFRLRGSLDLGRKKGDLPLLVTSLKVAQGLAYQSGMVNTLEVELADPSQAAELAAAIRDLVGDAFQVESWTERERASYLFLETTRWMALAVILGITAVAAIGVYSTLLLSVLHNRSKIAVLMALGIRNRSIYMALLSSALFMGLIGLILGSLVGYFGSELLIVHFAESLERLGLDDPSTAIGPGDLLLAGCATFGLFALTAVVPARRAVAMDPIENLHR